MPNKTQRLIRFYIEPPHFKGWNEKKELQQRRLGMYRQRYTNAVILKSLNRVPYPQASGDKLWDNRSLCLEIAPNLKQPVLKLFATLPSISYCSSSSCRIYYAPMCISCSASSTSKWNIQLIFLSEIFIICGLTFFVLQHIVSGMCSS